MKPKRVLFYLLAKVVMFFICISSLEMQKLYAQQQKIDSLFQLLQKTGADTNRVTYLWQLAQQYQNFKPDTTLLLAQEGRLLAIKLKYTEGESRSLALLAAGQYMMGNYAGALKHYMQKLQIEESRKSARNYASALNNIGLMYILLADYPVALQYLRRSDSACKAAGPAVEKELGKLLLINLGESFYRLKIADSAFLYFNAALQSALSSHDIFYQGVARLGLGNVQQQQGQDSLALSDYMQAFTILNDGLNQDMICETTLGIAAVYLNLGQKDSALYYANIAYNTARQSSFMSRELDAANFLSTYYERIKNYEQAFIFKNKAVVLQDVLKGQEATRQSQIISSNEVLRQQELAALRQAEKEANRQQLQILAICIFIPSFFVITMLVSRIRIHRRFVRFMGVVSLLLLFEFLVLLLHPLIQEITHHNKVYELLILVVIGAGLVPLHHWLEHIVLEHLSRVKQQVIYEDAIATSAETPIIIIDDLESPASLDLQSLEEPDGVTETTLEKTEKNPAPEPDSPETGFEGKEISKNLK